MPTWGWFVVALVLVDAAVLAAWFIARKSPPKPTAAATASMPAGLDNGAREEIHHLISENKKILAIALFRDRTGSGLKEAKDIIESVERGNPLPPARDSTNTTGSGTDSWEDIVPKLRTLKDEGRTIAAIALLRSRSGLPLREAKDAVDRL